MSSNGISLLAVIAVSAACARVDPPVDGDSDADGVAQDADRVADSDLDSGHDADHDADFDQVVNDVIIYAHSRDTLFAFSPFLNSVVSEVLLTLPDGTPAPFMVDLAVSADGEVYTSGFDSLFHVDPETGIAVLVGDLHTDDGELLGQDLGVNLYALTFIPRSLYPDALLEEVLIGAANEGTCYEVDPTTATARYIGTYPEPWRSSGDLVAVEGLGTVFATLRERDVPSTAPDYLAQITFMEGGRIELSMPREVRNDERSFVEIFGLGFWGRGLFGFTDAGELVAIDRTTATAELATEDTGATEFWGAGVTTRVPVVY